MKPTLESTQTSKKPQSTLGTPAARSIIAHVAAPGAGKPARSEPFASGSSPKKIRVLLADDHPVVRKGLATCLAQAANTSIIGEATNGQEAVRKAKELCPDIVLMDIDMPLLNGLTAADMLRKENPGIKVLILSMHNDSDYVLRILQSGARGYILKQAPTDELLKAIETIHAGDTYFSQDMARLALNQFVRGPGEGPHSGQISAR